MRDKFKEFKKRSIWRAGIHLKCEIEQKVTSSSHRGDTGKRIQHVKQMPQTHETKQNTSIEQTAGAAGYNKLLPLCDVR